MAERPARHGWIAALVAAILLVLAGPALAGKRAALVIGNGDYRALQKLTNPPHDAADVASALRGLGFEVDEPGIDLTRAEMEAAVERFAANAADADVTLFYYAGHGLQVSSRNFLIPVDAELKSEADVRRGGIDLDWIIRKLEAGPGAHIIVLDACRNNPLGGDLEDGLATPVPPENFFIAYSAMSNRVAFDGSGRNSPFAKALLAYLPMPGEDISSVLVNARKDVVADTGGNQIPTDWSVLTREVVLKEGERLPFPPETMLWQLAGGGPDADLLQVYLDRYPEGAHAEDARVRLAEARTSGDENSATRTTGADAAKVEGLLWTLAQNGRSLPLVELYLARYPDGAHVEEARRLLAALPAPDDPNASPDVICERLATHPNDSTANIRGVSLEELRRHREPAVKACRAAVAKFPDNPHYVALLARALAAGRQQGQPIPDEAIQLYREAADRGDARAMHTLGRLLQTGDSVPKDLKAAMLLYERAAERGNADAAINLAVALYRGVGSEVNVARAIELLRSASADGSAMATYNLAVFNDEGVTGSQADALSLFLEAAEQGETRAYVAAAKLLDEGRGVDRDPARAAKYLLDGVATDPGDAMNEVLTHTDAWSLDTIKEVQARLEEAGYYTGAVDAKSGPKLAAALAQWRLLGPPPQG